MVTTEEMMDAIEKDNVVFFATATKERVPNVVPIGFARPIEEDTILIVDNFLKKHVKILKITQKQVW